MAAEIDHRARNMLAVIQSITRMTKGTDVADVKAKLIDRFTALSRVHSLLGRKRWTNLAFRDLLEDELAPLGSEISERVTLDGPRLLLSPQQAQPFAMILHELMTNALKYGSIAQRDGRLSVSWSVDADQNMTLDWVESGAPAKAVPDLGNTRGGFGSVLLANLVKGQFGGEVTCTLDENGISYRFSLPVDRQVRPSGPPAEPETQRPKPQKAVLSVMVVEDNALISLDLADLLASEGHHVFGQFGTVEAALEALRRGTPDIVLLDAELGDESSAPVAEALNAKSVPFVVVSGHGGSFAADDPRVAAPRIEKPIGNSELLSVVKQTVE
nr:HWE histidine kinase domain-containing protein [Sulfitobacter sp. THAF37]